MLVGQYYQLDQFELLSEGFSEVHIPNGPIRDRSIALLNVMDDKIRMTASYLPTDGYDIPFNRKEGVWQIDSDHITERSDGTGYIRVGKIMVAIVAGDSFDSVYIKITGPNIGGKDIELKGGRVVGAHRLP